MRSSRMIDYREKTVEGMVTDGSKFRKAQVTVRMTSDKLGKSLSLEADGAVMIVVPLEEISGIIRLA